MDFLDSAANVFALSLVFALISFSVYLTTAIMKVTDVACDSCVTLGGCTYGALVVVGINPIIAVFAAMLCGVIAGFTISSITNHIKIELVLSSVITMSIIQTFVSKLCNFGETIRGNLHKTGNIFGFSPIENAIIIFIIVSIVAFLFYKFLNSEYGLAMRVYGDGIIISESLGIDTKHVLWVGLGLSNGLVAGAGALMTQVIGNFSTAMGAGALVFGIASVIIGQRFATTNSVKESIIGCFIGAIIYKIAIEVVTSLGSSTVGSDYNNIIIAIVLIFLMVTVNDQRKQENLENF
ncbi:MAG: hypothetical protein IJT36_05570 [Alphaproteobacteria bacterium]|nr:hypothetical protein [Alphaproteobacteria bacterium]